LTRSPESRRFTAPVASPGAGKNATHATRSPAALVRNPAAGRRRFESDIRPLRSPGSAALSCRRDACRFRRHRRHRLRQRRAGQVPRHSRPGLHHLLGRARHGLEGDAPGRRPRHPALDNRRAADRGHNRRLCGTGTQVLTAGGHAARLDCLFDRRRRRLWRPAVPTHQPRPAAQAAARVRVGQQRPDGSIPDHRLHQRDDGKGNQHRRAGPAAAARHGRGRSGRTADGQDHRAAAQAPEAGVPGALPGGNGRAHPADLRGRGAVPRQRHPRGLPGRAPGRAFGIPQQEGIRSSPTRSSS